MRGDQNCQEHGRSGNIDMMLGLQSHSLQQRLLHTYEQDVLGCLDRIMTEPAKAWAAVDSTAFQVASSTVRQPAGGHPG
jgi:hypothetical protein